MINAKRMFSAAVLAVGVTGLTASAAAAAPVDGPAALSVNDTLDTVATSSVPEEHRDEVPAVSDQLGKLNELRQLTDQAQPVTNLLMS
ncbi:hypothetical protein ACIBI4_19620 [Streptomyces sp. NPDC050418]|uniref:hypothetical protein n=1 Tax=Streptomyces sp. NPDC050418 TaxID=3365612 RepID=UPI0037886C9E